MKLYSTRYCAKCREAKRILKDDERTYTEVMLDTDAGMDELEAECLRLGLDMPRSMPVLIFEDMLYSGGDVIVALEEGEV